MKKLSLILMLVPISAFARSRGMLSTAPTWTDTGDSPIPFSINGTTTSWTTLVSSDTIRRHLFVQLATDSTVGVCIATTTNANDQCTNTTPGIELSTTTSSNAQWNDNSTSKWTFRGRTTTISGATVTVKGIWYRDSGDFGATGVK